MKKVLRIAALAGVFFGGIAYADHSAPMFPTHSSCATSYRALLAVHELDEAAEHFAESIQNLNGYSHITSDVYHLAIVAAHVHEKVEGGETCRHIRNDFNEVQRAYWHVFFQMRRAHNVHHNRHILRDWYRLYYAYVRARNAIYYSHHYVPH